MDNEQSDPISASAILAQSAITSLETILENSNDAIFGKTLDNTIIMWSRGAERVYGYTRDEMVGRPVSVLMPPDRSIEASELIGRIAAGEHVENFETERVTKDGRRLSVSLNIIPVSDSAGRISGALTIARDNTDRRHLEAVVKHLEVSAQNTGLMLETANRVALDILSSVTGVDALRHIAEAARRLANARYGALGVARQDGPGLSEFVTVGLSPEEEATIGPRPVGIGILGHLLTLSEPLLIDNLSDFPQSVGFPENHPPMGSFLGVPIRRGNMAVGSLYLTNKQDGGSFTQDDAVAVQALGAHAAVAVYHLQMLTRQRALLKNLINAQEEERRAVAYDLHDGLTQYVMAAHAHIEAFRRANESTNIDKANRELKLGLTYLKEAVIESRRLVNGLRSLALDDLGLAGALEQLLDEETARTGWSDASLVHNLSGKRFDKSLETAVYRIGQEALTNIHKHAQANRVRVMLLLTNEEKNSMPQLKLEIRDWGKGFIPEHHLGIPGHVGVQGMQERANLVGGFYNLESKPGEGTIVSAVFPALEPEPEEIDG